MCFGIHEFYIKSFRGDIVKYCKSKEEAQIMANKLNKVLGYDNYLVDDRWI